MSIKLQQENRLERYVTGPLWERWDGGLNSGILQAPNVALIR